jgi:hypothetical protein
LAFGVVLALAGLLIRAEIRQVLWFRGKTAGIDAVAQVQIGDALIQQERIAEAGPRFTEAARLAEQANRLTEYRDPQQFWTLANAYAATGCLDKAIDAARSGRELALVTGQKPLADSFQERMDSYAAARKAQADGRK